MLHCPGTAGTVLVSPPVSCGGAGTVCSCSGKGVATGASGTGGGDMALPCSVSRFTLGVLSSPCSLPTFWCPGTRFTELALELGVRFPLLVALSDESSRWLAQPCSLLVESLLGAEGAGGSGNLGTCLGVAGGVFMACVGHGNDSCGAGAAVSSAHQSAALFVSTFMLNQLGCRLSPGVVMGGSGGGAALGMCTLGGAAGAAGCDCCACCQGF